MQTSLEYLLQLYGEAMVKLRLLEEENADLKTRLAKLQAPEQSDARENQ